MKQISLFDFYAHFSTEEVCEDYLIELRWGGKPKCPHCGSEKIYKVATGYKCGHKECYFRFNSKTDTVFQGSKIPLKTWFNYIFYQASNNKNLSSIQNAKNIGITQKSMWYMGFRIRSVLNQDDNIKLSGIIEVDEAFLSKGKTKWTRWGGISTRKAPILGLIERGGGRLIIKEIEDRKRETILKLIEKYVEFGSTVYTDGAMCYKTLSKNYTHEFVEHSTREYVRGDVHTNNIEGVWRMLKSNIRHAHHSVSEKHVQAYCNELCYRRNMKDISASDIFNDILIRCINQRPSTLK